MASGHPLYLKAVVPRSPSQDLGLLQRYRLLILCWEPLYWVPGSFSLRSFYLLPSATQGTALEFCQGPPGLFSFPWLKEAFRVFSPYPPSLARDKGHFLLKWIRILGKAWRNFPGGTSGKEPTCQCKETELGSISGLGRYSGGGNGNPLQYSCLENPTDRLQFIGWQSVRHDCSDLAQRNFELLLLLQSKPPSQGSTEGPA